MKAANNNAKKTKQGSTQQRKFTMSLIISRSPSQLMCHQITSHRFPYQSQKPPTDACMLIIVAKGWSLLRCNCVHNIRSQIALSATLQRNDLHVQTSKALYQTVQTVTYKHKIQINIGFMLSQGLSLKMLHAQSRYENSRIQNTGQVDVQRIKL